MIRMRTQFTSCRIVALLVIIVPALAVAQSAKTKAPTKSSASKTVGASKTGVASLRDLTSQYVGAGGCAAAACHGESADSKSRPSSKNAYSLWMVLRDPHSIAYSVLKTDASRRILWLLDGANPPPTEEEQKPWRHAAPHRDPRCLTCHSILPDASATVSDHLLADGVSCEACHGPAASWLKPHTTAGWLALGPNRYQSIDQCAAVATANESKSGAAPSGRMWNTRDIQSRANVCVRCHVGGPDRDVNHDLIAAGHPRLNFEFAAFMANLPKHWDDSLAREALQYTSAQAAPRELWPDQSNWPPEKRADNEIRLWAAGQLASSRAAAALLDQRAGAAENELPTGALHPAWPELSEYDCFACHHDLSAPSWRQELSYTAGRRKPGELPWGTWHFSRLQEDLWPTVLRTPSYPTAEISDVRGAMATLGAKPDAVAPRAKTLAEALCANSAAVTADWTAPKISAAMVQIADADKLDSWDEAAQRYLALVAFANAYRRVAGNQTPATHAEMQTRLEAIRKNLNFGPGYRSPAHFSQKTVATLREQFSDLRDHIQARSHESGDR
jgi:hypothetical protein